MNEPSFPTGERRDGLMLIKVSTSEQWNDYHDIRRTVLYDARGLTGYDANHPDDR